MSRSKIEWTEVTWNPVTGCTKISDGCRNCYAETMSKRLKSMGQYKYRNGFTVTTHPHTLTMPYEWKQSSMVFVNSMSDLFHNDVPLEFIQDVFAVMNETPQHVYQILTKRSERLLEVAEHVHWSHNIWMGVSVENDTTKDRITDLKRTPAKNTFISFEPLIGEVCDPDISGISWIIVGGESGPKARPIKEEWIIAIKESCAGHNIPFFFKQWGKSKFNTDTSDPTIDKKHPSHAKGGCYLQGMIYHQIPAII